jgi:cardiolipin synthase
MKKFIKFVYSSRFLLAFAFLLNVAFFVVFSIILNTFAYDIIVLLGGVTAIAFLNKSDDEISYKIPWLILIVIFPLFGTLLYLSFKTRKGTRKQRKNWQSITYGSAKFLEQSAEAKESLIKSGTCFSNINNYILNVEQMPVYQNSTSLYLPSGEDYFKELFEDLKAAKKYILLEYFIIKPSKIWDELFEILCKKARDGVEIKLIYDDFGCLDRFPDKKLFKKLNNHKIESVPFNKVKASFNLFVNYRNHRKLAVIDGKTAYTGGINIGDEYANIDNKFGYWKDTAIKICGPAVWNFVIMFFNNWILSTKQAVFLEKYKPNFTEVITLKNKEYIQPFSTGPLSCDSIARNLYVKIISSAKNYVYITTPYLILDTQIQQSLKLASLSGVDVRIIMPGVPDKKWVFYLGRSHYESLINAGIKIYEYTPGFIHSKMIIADNELVMIGSVNFDFRSMYCNFENGVLINSGKTILNIKQDFDSIISSSHLVSYRDLKQRKLHEKVAAQIVKFFAPLL